MLFAVPLANVHHLSRFIQHTDVLVRQQVIGIRPHVGVKLRKLIIRHGHRLVTLVHFVWLVIFRLSNQHGFRSCNRLAAKVVRHKQRDFSPLPLRCFLLYLHSIYNLLIVCLVLGIFALDKADIHHIPVLVQQTGNLPCLRLGVLILVGRRLDVFKLP